MSPSTHQDGPKVPEHPAGPLGEALSDILWPWAATKAGACPNFSEAPDECDCVTCKALVALREAEDAPPSIPISALLSDEVVEAVLESEEVANELRRVVRATDEESLDEAAAYLFRAALTAAIEQVGGAK